MTDYCSEECRLIHESALAQIRTLRQMVSDHEQRFDTAQTWWWRRLWWWFRWGWPLHDWNAERPAWRPWNRDRRPGP